MFRYSRKSVLSSILCNVLKVIQIAVDHLNLGVHQGTEVLWRRRYYSFFVMRFLFIWANISFYRLTSRWFKSRRVSEFVINCFWNCQEAEERETTRHDFGKSFSIFKFLKLCQLKQMFLINYQYVQSYYVTSLLTLWHTIKQIWSMFLKCRYVRGIAWHVPIAAYSFLLSKSEGILSYRNLKRSYFTW